MKTLTMWVCAVFLIVMLGVMAWPYDNSGGEPVVESMAGDNVISHRALKRSSNTHALSANASNVLPEMAGLKTFDGAQVDGALNLDANNHLMLEIGVKRWIDFYLSAQGEVPLDTIVAAMQRHIKTLPQPAQTQALELLGSYLAYLNALAQYDDEMAKRIVSSDMDDVLERLAWQTRMRRQWLDHDVVAAFFAQDELLDDYAVAKLKLIQHGADQAAFEALENTLPQDIREARALNRLVDSHQVREAQVGKDKKHEWRVQQYGEQAAHRLAELDERRQRWSNKLQADRAYQQSLNEQVLSPTERAERLQSYRHMHFTLNEQKRLHSNTLRIHE